jgi:hypothetical protein
MAFIRRALGFQSLHAGRGWLVAAAFAALLSGCGGDGMDGCPIVCFPDIDSPTTVSWQNRRYTIVTSPAGTEPVTLEALVRVEAFYLLSSDVVSVEPNAPNQNPGPDAASYPVVLVDTNDDGAVGQAVVRFAVRIVGDAGSYPKGEFPFTATFRHGEDVVTAAMTLVVQ